MGTPARNYKWADAEPGNTIAMRSGAWSPRVIEPLSAEILVDLLAVIEQEGLGYLLKPTFAPALERTAVALARVFNESAYVAEHPDDERAQKRLEKFEGSAAWWLDRCGLTPASRAKIERSISGANRDRASLDRLLAEGRRVRLAAERRLGITNGPETMQEPPDDANGGSNDQREGD